METSGKARQSKLKECYTHASPTLMQGLQGLGTVVVHIFDTHSVVNLGSLMRLCLQKHKKLKKNFKIQILKKAMIVWHGWGHGFILSIARQKLICRSDWPLDGRFGA